MPRCLAIIAAVVFALLGGCTIQHYHCSCGDKCQCMTAPVPVAEPVVSPDKIDGTKQDAEAPAYPNIRPWYDD